MDSVGEKKYLCSHLAPGKQALRKGSRLTCCAMCCSLPVPPGALGAADPPLSSPALLLSLRGLPRDPPVLHIHFPSPLDLLTALQTYCFISPFRNQILCPLFLLYGACLSLFPLKQSSLKDLSGLPSPLPLSHSVSLAIRLSFPQLLEDAGSSRGFLVTSSWKIQEQPPAPSPSIRGKHS